jgi:hypothetical protein
VEVGERALDKCARVRRCAIVEGGQCVDEHGGGLARFVVRVAGAGDLRDQSTPQREALLVAAVCLASSVSAHRSTELSLSSLLCKT